MVGSAQSVCYPVLCTRMSLYLSKLPNSIVTAASPLRALQCVDSQRTSTLETMT